MSFSFSFSSSAPFTFSTSFTPPHAPASSTLHTSQQQQHAQQLQGMSITPHSPALPFHPSLQPSSASFLPLHSSPFPQPLLHLSSPAPFSALASSSSSTPSVASPLHPGLSVASYHSTFHDGIVAMQTQQTQPTPQTQPSLTAAMLLHHHHTQPFDSSPDAHSSPPSSSSSSSSSSLGYGGLSSAASTAASFHHAHYSSPMLLYPPAPPAFSPVYVPLVYGYLSPVPIIPPSSPTSQPPSLASFPTFSFPSSSPSLSYPSSSSSPSSSLYPPYSSSSSSSSHHRSSPPPFFHRMQPRPTPPRHSPRSRPSVPHLSPQRSSDRHIDRGHDGRDRGEQSPVYGAAFPLFSSSRPQRDVGQRPLFSPVAAGGTASASSSSSSSSASRWPPQYYPRSHTPPLQYSSHSPRPGEEERGSYAPRSSSRFGYASAQVPQQPQPQQMEASAHLSLSLHQSLPPPPSGMLPFLPPSFFHPLDDHPRAASAAALSALKREVMQGRPSDSKETADDDPDVKTCSVCISDFEKGDVALVLPCSHPYHDLCLLPWLRKQNTCPSCRFELLTDDEPYNRLILQKQERQRVEAERRRERLKRGPDAIAPIPRLEHPAPPRPSTPALPAVLHRGERDVLEIRSDDSEVEEIAIDDAEDNEEEEVDDDLDTMGDDEELEEEEEKEEEGEEEEEDEDDEDDDDGFDDEDADWVDEDGDEDSDVVEIAPPVVHQSNRANPIVLDGSDEEDFKQSTSLASFPSATSTASSSSGASASAFSSPPSSTPSPSTCLMCGLGRVGDAELWRLPCSHAACHEECFEELVQMQRASMRSYQHPAAALCIVCPVCRSRHASLVRQQPSLSLSPQSSIATG